MTGRQPDLTALSISSLLSYPRSAKNASALKPSINAHASLQSALAPSVTTTLSGIPCASTARCSRMYFGVEPPFVRLIAYLPPTAPAAWRCALPIISHSWSGSTMSASRRFSQTPRSRQRQNRRWVFFQSPRSGGGSRHGAPVRNIQNTALINSPLSPSGRPRLPFFAGEMRLYVFPNPVGNIMSSMCVHSPSRYE